MWISRGNILHSNRPNASQLSCSISSLMFPTGSCHQPSALASFCCSPESPPCRSSLMFAGKLGGVQVVRQVEDRWFDASESFGEAIETLDRWSWPSCVGSGPLIGAPCLPSRGIGLPASPDQGCLFLLLRF